MSCRRTETESYPSLLSQCPAKHMLISTRVKKFIIPCNILCFLFFHKICNISCFLCHVFLPLLECIEHTYKIFQNVLVSYFYHVCDFWVWFCSLIFLGVTGLIFLFLYLSGSCFFFFFTLFIIYLFLAVLVFVAAHGLSIVVVSGSYFSLQSTGSRCGIFQPRDQTCVPCIERQIINHWTTGEGLTCLVIFNLMLDIVYFYVGGSWILLYSFIDYWIFVLVRKLLGIRLILLRFKFS